MKIIATEISNLTDARYFAAWGVEILCFNHSDVLEGKLSGQQIKEMIDWIEGPKSALKIDALEIDDSLSELIALTDVDHLIVGPYIDRDQIPSSVKNVIRTCTLENVDLFSGDIIISGNNSFNQLSQEALGKINNLKATNIKRSVFIDFNCESVDLAVISSMQIDGLVLQGGEEEKVGFKSYDELDEIFEWMEENDLV